MEFSRLPKSCPRLNGDTPPRRTFSQYDNDLAHSAQRLIAPVEPAKEIVMFRPMLVVLVCLVATLSASQTASPANQSSEKKLRIVRIANVNPTSGAQMYQSYCASCHGAQGKGNGPAVEFLQTPAPDLTKLSLMNGGEYPEARVFAKLRHSSPSGSEASLTMPDWDRLFRNLHSNQSQVNLREYNLTTYIQSLQE